MTEGRYPPDDMFKADFEKSRPPRKPSIKERISDALDSATSSLAAKSRRRTQVRHSMQAKPAAVTPGGIGADTPKTVIQHPTKNRTSRLAPATPQPSVQAEEDIPAAQASPAPPLVESPVNDIELADAPVDPDLQDPAPLTRRQTGAGMARWRRAPLAPQPSVQAEEDIPAAQASPALAADGVVEPSPPPIVREEPSKFLTPTSPVDSEVDALDGTPMDPQPASGPSWARRFAYSSPASRTEDKDWPLQEDSALFGYSTGDELQMPESPLERLRGVFRSVSGRHANQDKDKKSLHQSSDEPVYAGSELVASADSASGDFEALATPQAEVVDPVQVHETANKGGAELPASTPLGESGHGAAMRSSVAGFRGRFRSPDHKSRAKDLVTVEQGVLSSSGSETERTPELPRVEERASSTVQSTASQRPLSQAPGPSVVGSSTERRKPADPELISGRSFSSLMASASALITKSRGGLAADLTSPGDVDSSPPVPKLGSPAGSPKVDIKTSSDARSALGRDNGPTPRSHYVPRHSVNRPESGPTEPLAHAGESEPPNPRQAASGPADRRSEAKSPPSTPFVPPRRDQARRPSNKSAVAGAISLGLIIVISVGVAKLNNSQSVKSTSTASIVTAPPTTRVATTTPTTLRASGIDSAPTTLPQPKSIVVATTTPQKSNTTLPATTTTKVTAIANPAYAKITVRVANGTTVSGAAGRVTSSLKALGFNVVVPINATVSDLSTTTVYYYTGFSVAGQAVAQILGLPASAAKPFTSSAPLPGIYPSDVNVVLGTDVAS